MTALQTWLHPDSNQIKAIREKLGGKRLVVLVDDLDRADPKLVPQLLLSFRELLDLPGFTFLLAFDEQIVGSALKDYHSAWTDGGDFLEKILDFRFYLPPVNDRQKLSLLRTNIRDFCSFVPEDSIATIQDLIPNNPRKLKALIRSMSALKGETDRHGPDELIWWDIWLAQLIKIESQIFFTNLMSGNVLESEYGVGFRLRTDVSQRRKPSEEERDPNRSLKSRLDEWGLKDEKLRTRLIQLVEALRARASVHFRYQAELAIRPHRITWKEFRQLATSWKETKQPQQIAEWIERQALQQSTSKDEVTSELFETFISDRQTKLTSASDATSLAKHDQLVAEAQETLIMLKQYFLDLGFLTPERFGTLFGQFKEWVGFVANEQDKQAREFEKNLALEFLSAGRMDSLMVLESIRPWARNDSWDSSPDVATLRSRLLADCTDQILHECVRRALALFRTTGGIRQLHERGRLQGITYCLLNISSPLWKDPLKPDLLMLIDSAAEDFVIYENSIEFAELLHDGRESRLDIPSENFNAIYRQTDFMSRLWTAITSRPIQYRMLYDFLKIRHHFIAGGVPESALALTPELEERSRELERPKVACSEAPKPDVLNRPERQEAPTSEKAEPEA